jgi:hypothetical protein
MNPVGVPGVDFLRKIDKRFQVFPVFNFLDFNGHCHLPCQALSIIFPAPILLQTNPQRQLLLLAKAAPLPACRRVI